MTDDDLSLLADASFGQYFLVSPEKLHAIFQAADLRPDDRVIEIGAGAGTVARSIPAYGSLTVVELDDRLLEHLRDSVPSANVVQGDGLRVVRESSFDVLFSNMPNAVTESLIDILPGLSFRVAVLAIGEHSDVNRLSTEFEVTEITKTTGDDFRPSMPSVSRIVKVTPRSNAAE